MTTDDAKKLCDWLSWIALWCFLIMLNTCSSCGNGPTLTHISETNDKILKELEAQRGR